MGLLMIREAVCRTAHLEQAQIPDVTPCLHCMRQSRGQLLNVSKAKVDPLPSQGVHHMGRVSDQSQSGPHIPEGLATISPSLLQVLHSQ